MRYLFWGVLSLFAASCTGANADVCRALAGPTAIETSRSMDRVTAKSREATVELASVRPKGIAYGTGTLFKYKGRTIIITAAHVVGSTKSRVLVMDGSKEASTSIVYFDEKQDIAVLSLDSHLDSKPLPLRPASPRNLKIGSEVLYSGYPNIAGLFTIKGYITGIHPSGHIFLHSYAWTGASGSAILDMKGRLIGILYALDVGPNAAGFPTMIEDIVVVVPIWKLDFKLLDLNLGV